MTIWDGFKIGLGFQLSVVAVLLGLLLLILAYGLIRLGVEAYRARKNGWLSDAAVRDELARQEQRTRDAAVRAQDKNLH